MNPSASEPVPRTGSRRYRPRRYYLFVGIGTLVAFVVMGIGSVAAAWWNVDGSFTRPKTAALIFGVFWTGFVLLSLWLLAAYFRERLRLGPSAVTCRGVFRVRRLRLRDVNVVVWRRVPAGGWLVLRTPEKRLKIELDNFTRSELEDIVAYFREAIPASRQKGWEEFDAAVRPPREASRAASARLIFALSAFAAFFGIAGLRRGELGYVLLGLLNAAFAAGLLFLRRRGPSSPEPGAAHSPSVSPQASARASSDASGSSKPGRSGVE